MSETKALGEERAVYEHGGTVPSIEELEVITKRLVSDRADLAEQLLVRESEVTQLERKLAAAEATIAENMAEMHAMESDQAIELGACRAHLAACEALLEEIGAEIAGGYNHRPLREAGKKFDWLDKIAALLGPAEGT